MYNVIGVLLFIIGVALYAKISLWEFYASDKHPTFFGPNSWMLKYKYPLVTVLKKNWYYRLFNLSYKEKFPLSATLFVWATDGFHLLQGLMIWCFTVPVVITQYNLLERPWWWTLGYILFYRILWSGTFTLFFNVIFKK